MRYVLLYRFAARDERRAYCPESGDQHAQLSGWRFDLHTFLYHATSSKTGSIIKEPAANYANYANVGVIRVIGG